MCNDSSEIRDPNRPNVLHISLGTTFASFNILLIIHVNGIFMDLLAWLQNAGVFSKTS